MTIARQAHPRAVATTAAVVVIGLAVVALAVRSLGQDVSAEADRLRAVLGVNSGSRVAEIGAGDGAMTMAVAGAVGTSGHVYSTELGADKVRTLRGAVRDAGPSVVTVTEGSDDGTGLPAGCCDAIFMRRVYHHFTHPAQMDASLFASLRPGGRLAVIDFEPRGQTPPPGVPANRKGHGVPAPLVVEELTRAGFVHERNEQWTDGMYLALFRRPAEEPGPRRAPAG